MFTLKSILERKSLALFLSLFYLNLMAQQADTSKSELLFLQLKAFDLDPIEVVSDSAAHKNNLNNPTAMNTTANMDEVLENLPDLQLVKRGGYAFDPQINGMSSQRIAVTIDGMRIFGACTDRMDPATSYIEPVNLKSAEVNCHSNAAQNGSNVGGNLGLQTRKAKFNDTLKVKGEINGALNSVSRGKDFSGGLSMQAPKWGARLNGAFRNHGNYMAGGGQEIKYTQYQKSNFSANLRGRIGEQWILNADYLYDKASDVGYAALPMDVAIAQTHLGSVGATGYDVLPIVERLEFKLYGNQIYHEMDDSRRPDEEISMRMDMPGWSNTYGAFVQMKFTEVGNHRIGLRADYYRNFRRAEMTMYPPGGGSPMFMLTWPNVVRNAAGLSLSDTWTMNSKTQLLGSARIEVAKTGITDEFGKKQLSGFGYDGDEVYTHTPHALSLTWQHKLKSELTLVATVSNASRLPSTSEMYGFFLFNKEDGYDYIGKPDIEMENSWKVLAEIKEEKGAFTWSSSMGYNRLNNFIYGVYEENSSAMTPGANGLKYYQNLPWAHFVNASLYGGLDLFKNWKLTTRWNYTWAEKMDKSSVSQIQPLMNTSGISYLGNHWFARVECENALAQNLTDPEWGEDSTPAWAILNLKLGYDLEVSRETKLVLRGGIENVLDNHYHRHLDWGNVARPGRNVYLNVGLRF